MRCPSGGLCSTLPLLNNSIVTITASVNPNGIQVPNCGVFFGDDQSGIIFGPGNELRHIWNNVAGTASFGSGLMLPTNQWTFVALVIQPTQAQLYMVSNGVFSGVTNNVANAIPGFNLAF